MSRGLPTLSAAAAVMAAAVLAGCGSSGRSTSASSSRAATTTTTASTTSTHEAAHVVGTPSARRSRARYGKLPSWLPHAKVPVGRVVTATAARPAYAIQGDTVSVVLPGGRARVTAVGPEVPPHGTPPPPVTRTRFVVTLAGVHGTVPLRQSAFSFRDEQGHTHRAQVRRLPGDRSLPSRLPAGRRPVSLVVTATLPSGNGALRWTPRGERPLVSWDFVVELD